MAKRPPSAPHKPRDLYALSPAMRRALAAHCELHGGITQVAQEWEVSLLTLRNAIDGRGLTPAVAGYLVARVVTRALDDMHRHMSPWPSD